MKTFVCLLWLLAVLSCLTTVAFADVIAGPMIALAVIVKLGPWLLLAVVVIITLRLLKRYRKK